MENKTGQPITKLANVAQQQAVHASQNIRRALQERPLKTFAYKDPGLLATKGRSAAVARMWRISFSGLLVPVDI